MLGYFPSRAWICHDVFEAETLPFGSWVFFWFLPHLLPVLHLTPKASRIV